MPEQVHGVLPALITPFTDDGSAIDTGALTALVDRVINAGVGGLVPGGSTGEFTTLTNGERRQLVEVTVGAAAGESRGDRGCGNPRLDRRQKHCATDRRPHQVHPGPRV